MDLIPTGAYLRSRRRWTFSDRRGEPCLGGVPYGLLTADDRPLLVNVHVNGVSLLRHPLSLEEAATWAFPHSTERHAARGSGEVKFISPRNGEVLFARGGKWSPQRSEADGRVLFLVIRKFGGGRYCSVVCPSYIWTYCSANKLVLSTDIDDDMDSSFSLSDWKRAVRQRNSMEIVHRRVVGGHVDLEDAEQRGKAMREYASWARENGLDFSSLNEGQGE